MGAILELDFDDEELEEIEVKPLHKNPIQFDTMIEGMSNKYYHDTGFLSSTKFSLMRLSFRAFENRHLFDFSKPAFDEGNLIHDCILLPDIVDDMYIESPTAGLDTKAAKELREANPHKIIAGQGMIEYYKDVAKLVHIIFPFIQIPTTKTEVSFFHEDEDSGLTFQVRPDIYNPDVGMLYDVKSTKANSHREFEKVIEEYDYDLSIAFYFDVIQMCGYKVVRDYTGWLCIPKTAPHVPFLFRVSEELLEKGRSKYQTLLTEYMEFKKTDPNDLNAIYQDIAKREAHSWEYRKENY